MAFMMPVIKPEFEIYPNRIKRIPRKATKSMPVTPRLSNSTEIEVEGRLIRVIASKSFSTGKCRHNSHCTSEVPTPKSASRMSLHKFHTRLVDKLKRKLHLQDSGYNSEDEVSACDSTTNKTTTHSS
ncbi:uncharacterized protein LOC106456854 [Limulus polyphemus]|uniref:Uncharacterized protein LOC106456854 n=1 Tax=Limulus polyphemus TaxID=6850 RepID=A0ABM1AZH2_LIMPO|nr:uncharacterized protein LOC106456854 [Limulus polyphemus]